MKTLLKNTNYGYIGIDGKKICYVGREKPADSYDTVKDMTGKLVFPGLHNQHTHLAMTLLRGAGSGLPLQKWLFDVIFPLEDRLNPTYVKAGIELGMLEMLASGTTSFRDMYFLYDESMEAMIDSGMRTQIGRSVQALAPDETYENSYRIAEAWQLYRNYNGAADGRMTIDFSIHSEYTNRQEIVEAFLKDIAQTDAAVHMHLSETQSEHEECIRKYGMTPTQWFASLGAFRNKTYAAHCVWITDEDMEILRDFNVTVVNNPSSNMKLGSGFAPVRKCLDQGIEVKLGTDGPASNNNLNMLEEMHLASLIINGYQHDPIAMQPEDIIRMATDDTIRVGAAADLFAINCDAPHLIPNVNDNALLCYSAQGSDVCMTMVDGRILYENGEYKTLDKERIYADVKAATKALYG